MINRIGLLYFSPGSTTKKISEAVSLGLGSNEIQIFDMTSFQSREDIMNDPEQVITDIDYLVVGAPVYSGKLPLQFIEAVKCIVGKGIKCCAFVVYGNRDYGIAFHQLVKILLKNKFDVIGAAAFIGQHSYSDIVPVAVGRPDKSDLDKAFEFGTKMLNSNNNLEVRDIPIQLDKISGSEKYTSLKPAYLGKQCVKCGICAQKCPLNLISEDTGTYLDRLSKQRCIGCMACVKHCKAGARITRANPIVKLVMKNILKKAARDRKEPLILVH